MDRLSGLQTFENGLVLMAAHARMYGWKAYILLWFFF